jgi:hypothetical protein
MEIQITPEQENLLAQFAIDKGKKPDKLAKEVIGHYLDDETLHRGGETGRRRT